jgi:hypothetical protein
MLKLRGIDDIKKLQMCIKKTQEELEGVSQPENGEYIISLNSSK